MKKKQQINRNMETDDPVLESNNATESSNESPTIEDAACSSASRADIVKDVVESNPGITVLIDNSRKNCDSSSNSTSKGSILNNIDLTIGFVDDDDELNDAIGLTRIDNDSKHLLIDEFDGGNDEPKTENGL